MYKTFSLFLFLGFLGCTSATLKETAPLTSEPPLVTNQFQAVWNEITSDTLTSLPQESLSYSKLFHGSLDIISQNAQRTLQSRADILQPFDKLAHPNGVCLKGLWEIDKENPYSGLFKNKTQALIIARASSAMSNTKRGETRAFGMAGKLFLTTDPLHLQKEPSANFFVIDDLGGTDAPYYTDVALTNEPNVSLTATLFGSIAYALKVASAFSSADEHSGIRQLYELSSLGEEANSTLITPKYFKLEAMEKQTKIGVEDFRQEFALKDGEKLYFNIFVSKNKKEWQNIGKIAFDASVISQTCDHRLHFHHPLWRDDIVYE